MKDSCHLVLSESGIERMTKKKPSLRRNEVAVKVTLSIADSAFSEPAITANITIPESAVIHPEITVDVQDADVPA